VLSLDKDDHEVLSLVLCNSQCWQMFHVLPQKIVSLNSGFKQVPKKHFLSDSGNHSLKILGQLTQSGTFPSLSLNFPR
jgi:hypothetical protein